MKKQPVSPVLIVTAYSLALILLGLVVLRLNLVYSMLAFAMAPIILLALLYPRPVYLILTGVAVLVSIWVGWQMGMDFRSLAMTVLLMGLATLIVAETSYRLALSYRHILGELQESESNYRTLIDLFPHTLLILQNEQIVFANQAALSLFNFDSLENLMAGDPFSVLDQEDRDRLKGDPPVAGRFQAAFTRPDGSHFQGEVVVRSIVYKGSPAVQASIHDISEHVQERDILQVSEERYRAISEISSDFAYMARVEENGEINVEWVVGAFQRITGYPPEDLLAMRDWLSLADEQDASRVAEHRRAILEGDAPACEFRIRTRSDEVRWVLHSTRAQRDDEMGRVTYLYGAVQDITERKLLEETRDIITQKLRTWVNDLEHRRQEDGLLMEMGDILQSCVNVGEVYAVVGQYAKALFSGQSGALYTFDDNRRLVTAMVRWGDNLWSEEVFMMEDCWALRRGRLHSFAPPRKQLCCAHVSRPTEMSKPIPGERRARLLFEGKSLSGDVRPGAENIYTLCVPINAQSEILGILYLQFQTDKDAERSEQLVSALAERTALALTNLKLRESLRAQAINDLVSGLHNRRYMLEILDHEIRRARLYDRPLSVALLDIDHLKQVNDLYGHMAGDAVMEKFGAMLKVYQQLGSSAGRYGGDEFLIVLPSTSIEEAFNLIDPLREQVRNLQVQFAEKLITGITFSAGVAAFPLHGDQPEAVLFSVEAALSRAKEDGYDRVCQAD